MAFPRTVLTNSEHLAFVVFWLDFNPVGLHRRQIKQCLTFDVIFVQELIDSDM